VEKILKKDVSDLTEEGDRSIHDFFEKKVGAEAFKKDQRSYENRMWRRRLSEKTKRRLNRKEENAGLYALDAIKEGITENSAEEQASR